MADKDIQQKLAAKRRRELVAYFGEFVRTQGIGAAVRRTLYFLKRRYGGKKGRFLPKKAELARQRAEDTASWPKISILVPVYRPDEGFFREMLQSVMGQTYRDWELCLVDGSPDGEPQARIVGEFSDRRIRYVQGENKGIAGNTNEAARHATGEYFALLDHDDVLAPHALYHMAKTAFETSAGFLYSDEALFTKDIQKPTVGHFKPDFSHQYLISCNYICHFSMLRRDVFVDVGGYREGFDGSQDHELFLRVIEKTGGAVHIPKVLYYWRQHAGSTSTGTEAKPYVGRAAKKAIAGHLERTGVKGSVRDGLFPSTYKVDYEIEEAPLVSIIIPSYEHVDDLDRCLASIYNKSSYRNFEVVIVENNSKDPATFRYYETVGEKWPGTRVVVYEAGGGFNFSKLCNFGRAEARGELLLFLNNDTEVISNGWLQEMASLCLLDEVGAVGAMLYYEDDTVQHAGVIVGLGGYAGHSHKYAARGKSGYMFRQAVVNEFSAVTGACLMVKASVFDEIGEFDENLSVAYNDVDLCLRICEAGKTVLFTPYAELYHYESKSRGSDEEGEKKQRADTERAYLKKRWGEALLRDPYYNPSLTLDREDFSENDVLPEG